MEDGGGRGPDAGRVFGFGFGFELGLVLVGVVIGLIATGEPFPFRLEWNLRDALAAVAATLPLLALAAFLTSPLGRRVPSLERIYRVIRSLVGDALRDLTGLELVLLSAAAGIGEEVLFRGTIQTLVGIVLSSLIFGALHSLTPGYFVLATLMGFYLGWLFEATGNLLVPTVVHFLYDAAALFLLRARFRTDIEADPVESGPDEKA